MDSQCRDRKKHLAINQCNVKINIATILIYEFSDIELLCIT